MKSVEAPEPIGWVLFDDSCGFCRRWVRFWEPTLRRRGLAVAALQDEEFGRRLGLSEAERLYDFRLLFVDGTHLSGADAYRFAMRRIWWAYPIYVLSILPGFRRVFDKAYRAFADNRHRWSKTCGLAGTEKERAAGARDVRGE